MDLEKDIIEFIKTKQHDKLKDALRATPGIAESHTEQGISLLQFAAYCRNYKAVTILRKYKDQLDIFESASIGDIDNVRKQLDHDPELLNKFGIDGFTPLGLSCYFGHDNIVKYLLEKGAQANVASNNAFKVAPLHSACAISHYPIVKLLLQNGADVNAKQMQGVTPLHSAAHNGQSKLAQMLIDKGADVNAKTDSGQSPLAMAVEKSYQETAEVIKKHGGQ